MSGPCGNILDLLRFIDPDVFGRDPDREQQPPGANRVDQLSGEKDLAAKTVNAHERRAITSELGIEPAAVVLVRDSSLPRTSAGKIPRHLCRELYLSDALKVYAAWPDPPPK